MSDKEFVEQQRKKINPQYADTIGTESYERKRLISIIDRLNATLQTHELREKGVGLIAKKDALIAVNEEPELNDEMPQELAFIINDIMNKKDMDGVVKLMRKSVKLTKRGIYFRIREL